MNKFRSVSRVYQSKLSFNVGLAAASEHQKFFDKC